LAARFRAAPQRWRSRCGHGAVRTRARFVAQSGETLVGHDGIRTVLSGLIEAKTHFRSNVIRAVTVDDIAQLYTDFEGTQVDDSGNTVAVRSKAIEVLRRQPDGSWKLIVGDPNGRAC
jgi:ketosteroid isomerase-like protein